MKNKNIGDIVVKAKSNERYLEIVLKKYQPLLKKTANLLYSPGLVGVSYDELILEGEYGLLKAVKGYDPTKGNFGGYARKWVHGEMCALVRKMGNSIPLSQRDLRIRKAQIHLEEYGELPVKYGDISESDLKKLLPSVHSNYEDEMLSDNLFVVDDFTDDSNHRMDMKSQLKIVKEVMLSVLTPLETKVVLMLNGFYSNEQLSLRAVASKIEYSPEGVRQINERAIRKIREKLGDGAGFF